MTKGSKWKVPDSLILAGQTIAVIYSSLVFIFFLSIEKYLAVLENRKRLLHYKSIFEKFVLQKMQICIVASLEEVNIFWRDTHVSQTDYQTVGMGPKKLEFLQKFFTWRRKGHQLEGELVSWERDFTQFGQLVWPPYRMRLESRHLQVICR